MVRESEPEPEEARRICMEVCGGPAKSNSSRRMIQLVPDATVMGVKAGNLTKRSRGTGDVALYVEGIGSSQPGAESQNE